MLVGAYPTSRVISATGTQREGHSASLVKPKLHAFQARRIVDGGGVDFGIK